MRISQHIFRFFVRLLSRVFYRIRVFDQENVPQTGAALLVPNHISWLDGILIMMITQRPVRMIVWSGNFTSRFMLWWSARWGAILVSPGPKSIVRALKTANQALNNGEVVCIFAEGGITRSGYLQAFKPGMMKILKGTDAPVIPVYLDELWGSIFSFERGKFFWKWPRKFRYPISVHYGKPLENVECPSDVRREIQLLSTKALDRRMQKHKSLTKSAIRMCKRRRFATKVADSSSGPLTGGNVLLRSLILRRILRRTVLKNGEKNVGVLLPPSNGGVLANLALSLDARVPVNLNYTVTSEVINHCIKAAGIQHVLTSRQVLSKLDLQMDTSVVELESFKDQVTTLDKVIAAFHAFVTPTWILHRLLGLHRIKPDELATIIFTSGSTGTPKGVMLSFGNVASNIEAIDQVVQLKPTDRIVGILPFFHSFGFTVTLWTPLSLDIGAVYHYSPLDGKRIGMLVKKYAATFLLATPTFLRSYIKRCKPEQFQSLEVVVAGAEKLPVSLSDAFEEKFGVRPVEGYGCTELSPLVSVNIPPKRSSAQNQLDRLEGSVGRPVPGVVAKTISEDTGEDLTDGTEGMLLIKGANVMQGYLGQPELTAEVVRDGWYTTGDIGFVDNDGFIHITGRKNRFSKIGGEMIPHGRIEDVLNGLIGNDEEQDDAPRLVVTAVPDERKGERLIVLHTSLDSTPDQLRQGLTDAGLPNIYIPNADGFIQVDAIPLLGTGKLDLHGVKQLAIQLAT